MTSGDASVIQVEPWPTERPLAVVVGLFSALIWILLAVSIVGLIYVLALGLFFFFAHVIFIAHVRGNAVRLGPNQFPDLYASVENLSRRMGFEKIPEAYLMQAGGVLNALATKFLRSNMIILFSDLIEACGENQAARDMIVGHELGHLKRGHLKWIWFFLPGRMVLFLGQAWSRAREYTCDRYGFAAAGNREGALLGLAILAAGAERGPHVNFEALARQVEGINTGWMTLGTWLATHPPISKRFIALDEGLRPSGYEPGNGVLRACAILGGVYVVPIVLAVIAAIVIGVAGVASKH